MIAAHGSERNPKYNLVEVSGGKMDFNDEAVAFKEYQDLLGAFDIVSDHTHSHWVYNAKMLHPDIMIQTTQHSQVNFTPPKSPNPNVPLPEPKPYNMCGISNHHSRESSGITGISFRTLYNGIDLARYKYKEKKGGRLLYVGRMEPFKGAHWALYTAKVLRMPLDLIGKDQDTNQEYVRQIKQETGNMKTAGYDVNYLGEVPHETKVELLADAYAVLFAALWNEPYGLIPVEAMASGTPVIATATGALPEVVKHGSTGWLANTLDEFAQLTLRAPQINPADCLAWVTERFSSKVMAERYVTFWNEIIQGRGW